MLLWNHDDRLASITFHQLFLFHCRVAAGWVEQVLDRIKAHQNGTPHFCFDLLRRTFSTPEYTALFQPYEEKVCPYRPLTTDQIVIDRALSWSYITLLPPDEKAKFAEDIKGILEGGDGKVWINKKEGTYQYPYNTLLLVSRKK